LSAAVHFFHQIKDEIRSCRFDPRDGFSHVKSGRYSDYAVPQHAKRMTDRELSFPWLFWPFHEIWIVRDKQAFINQQNSTQNSPPGDFLTLSISLWFLQRFLTAGSGPLCIKIQ